MKTYTATAYSTESPLVPKQFSFTCEPECLTEALASEIEKRIGNDAVAANALNIDSYINSPGWESEVYISPQSDAAGAPNETVTYGITSSDPDWKQVAEQAISNTSEFNNLFLTAIEYQYRDDYEGMVEEEKAACETFNKLFKLIHQP